MKACFVVTLALLAAVCSPAQLPYTEKQVIDYAKSIDVSTLDPSLPSQRLEDWLQSGPPHAHIGYWIVADTCDLKDPEVPYPLCARISFYREGQNGDSYGQQGYLLVQVGNSKDGIVGRAQLFYPSTSVWEGMRVMTGDAERLSELPTLLDQPAVTGAVQKLYEEIVAHHPVGIPENAEIVRLRPFLSKRLGEQLQTAQACEKDYFRQHPTTNGAPKPAWMKSGVFTGDGQRVLPIQAIPVRKEPQKDGSFLVDVSLVHSYTGHGSHYFYFAGHKAQGWEVVATVVPENGRFVVDDIRIFDNDSTEGPSHLLSDAFVGCEGPRWSGLAAGE